MATCQYCGREILEADGCNITSVAYPDRSVWLAIPYGSEKRFSGEQPLSRCHDCNVVLGKMHHPGCDVEECPRCGGQLISCGCLSEGVSDG